MKVVTCEPPYYVMSDTNSFTAVDRRVAKETEIHIHLFPSMTSCMKIKAMQTVESFVSIFCFYLKNKKLGCHRETAGYFLFEYFAKSLKVIRNDTLEEAVSPVSIAHCNDVSIS